MERTVPTITALKEEAGALLERLVPGTQATLITLSGELGAGKTAFTQQLAQALGIEEPITSPTFVLEKIYELPHSSVFKRLIHIDAYRLNGGDELRALGFDEVMEDSGNLIVLEWPEKVADGLPQASISITLTPLPDGTRTLVYG